MWLCVCESVCVLYRKACSEKGPQDVGLVGQLERYGKGGKKSAGEGGGGGNDRTKRRAEDRALGL